MRHRGPAGRRDRRLEHARSCPRLPCDRRHRRIATSVQADALLALAKAEAKYTAAHSRVLAAFNAQGGYEDDGHRSARSWLRWRARGLNLLQPDLDRQVARVTAWAAGEGHAVGRVVTEVGSALDGKRRKFLALLGDPSVTVIAVEHRDRFARFGAEYVEAALAAQGRQLLVMDPSGLDDDLVRDVTEILTTLCARLYGRRAAADRAKRAVEAATGPV